MLTRAKKRHKFLCKPSLLASECCISQLTSKFLSGSDVARLACVCGQLLKALRYSPIDASHVDLTLQQVSDYFGSRTSQWRLVGASIVDRIVYRRPPPMPEGVVLRHLGLRVQSGLLLANLDLEKLKTMDLEGQEWVLQVSGLRGCSNLHTLNLDGCNQLTDISALGSCSNLHTLNLIGCRQLRDISALGSHSNLHMLNLIGCSQLTDISALGSCSNLHTLSLYGCDQLRDFSALGTCRIIR